MTSRKAITIILILLVAGAGIITYLTIQKPPVPAAPLKCIQTNRTVTMICTDTEGNKTRWRKEK